MEVNMENPKYIDVDAEEKHPANPVKQYAITRDHKKNNSNEGFQQIY